MRFSGKATSNRHTDTKHPDSLTGTLSAPNNQVTCIFVPDGAG